MITFLSFSKRSLLTCVGYGRIKAEVVVVVCDGGGGGGGRGEEVW